MVHDAREFDAGPDPFGRTWHVTFAWLQTAISIRHADAVDVKFFLSSGGERMEKVVALPDPDLLTLSQRTGHAITDPWCMKLAALHIREMVATFDDMEKTLVTVPLDKLTAYAGAIEEQSAPVGR